MPERTESIDYQRRYAQLWDELYAEVCLFAPLNASALDLTDALIDKVMEFKAAAYDEGFTQAEEESDGFPGVSGWTNRNPYVPAPIRYADFLYPFTCARGGIKYPTPESQKNV